MPPISLSTHFSGSVYAVSHKTPSPIPLTTEQIKQYCDEFIAEDKRTGRFDGGNVQPFVLDDQVYMATGSRAEQLMHGFNQDPKAKFLDVYIRENAETFLAEVYPLTVGEIAENS